MDCREPLGPFLVHQLDKPPHDIRFLADGDIPIVISPAHIHELVRVLPELGYSVIYKPVQVVNFLVLLNNGALATAWITRAADSVEEIAVINDECSGFLRFLQMLMDKPQVTFRRIPVDI